MLGYDDGPAAHAAMEWVADRARDARIWVQLTTVSNMLVAERAEDAEMLERAAARLREMAPTVTVETLLFDGFMPHTLSELARGTDLLVIGVDPSRPLREALHGWRALRITAEATVPVCVVPRGWELRSGPVTVGVSDDGSSDSAVAFGAAEAHRAGRPLCLVHSWTQRVLVDSTDVHDYSPRAAAAAHHRVLEQAAQKVHASYSDLAVETHTAHSNPSAAITSLSGQSSLVVIGTHHRGVLAGGFYGSIAQDIIGSVAAPVCVVPPAPRQAEPAEDARAAADREDAALT